MSVASMFGRRSVGVDLSGEYLVIHEQVRRERVHRQSVLHQHSQSRNLLAEVHRLDAQPDLDALVRGTNHDSRLAQSSTVAQAARSAWSGTSTMTPLGRCTRNAAPGVGMRTVTRPTGLWNYVLLQALTVRRLKVRNFRALREVEIRNLTPLTVLLGPNGSGKSTVFDVFAFLSECFSSGLRRAWDRRGRAREIRTRDAEGPMTLELQYRERRHAVRAEAADDGRATPGVPGRRTVDGGFPARTATALASRRLHVRDPHRNPDASGAAPASASPPPRPPKRA